MVNRRSVNIDNPLKFYGRCAIRAVFEWIFHVSLSLYLAVPAVMIGLYPGSELSFQIMHIIDHMLDLWVHLRHLDPAETNGVLIPRADLARGDVPPHDVVSVLLAVMLFVCIRNLGRFPVLRAAIRRASAFLIAAVLPLAILKSPKPGAFFY